MTALVAVAVWLLMFVGGAYLIKLLIDGTGPRR